MFKKRKHLTCKLGFDDAFKVKFFTYEKKAIVFINIKILRFKNIKIFVLESHFENYESVTKKILLSNTFLDSKIS